ncbi:alpha/beta hydrolase [Acetobacter sp. AN02]|uniref:alpha/beta fold hydrolase n=1 Tax=Acetobacter sp. AN02 TaxID=2894186 RepID=UPI0024345BCA|nr:alpha/beta fold hydrolase [Acetobacter sp. AN02]MDG6095292.1 alpha/beta hydrolase [Acetobacter sp. AN02]
MKAYNRLIPHLLHQGFTVCGFDLPGHGESPGPWGVLDGAEVVRHHLAARAKLRGQALPVFLYGHSLGGFTVAASVSRDSSGLAGVILGSAALGNPLPWPFPSLMRAVARLFPRLPLVHLPADRLTHIEAVREEAAHDPLMYKGSMCLLLASSILKISAADRCLYPGWTAPVLVLHGTEDFCTDPVFGVRAYEAMRSEKTLYLVPGAYHELLNDTRRDDVLAAMLEWLDRRVIRFISRLVCLRR